MTNQSPKSKMMWAIFWSINHMYWYLHFVFARWDLEANPLSSKWVMCLPSYVADGFTLVSPVVCLLCSSLELTLSHIDADWAVSDVFEHQFYNCTSYFELLLRLNELCQCKNVCRIPEARPEIAKYDCLKCYVEPFPFVSHDWLYHVRSQRNIVNAKILFQYLKRGKRKISFQ